MDFRKVIAVAGFLFSFLFGSSAFAQDSSVERVTRFRGDVQAFARDLEALKDGKGRLRLTQSRARHLAYLAVSEAYRYDLPPALVLGVMLVENPEMKSGAASFVGAQGLMQVMPLWKPSLGKFFGFDLTDEATNLRYGVWILAHYLALTGNVDRALLRYNGCVKGTNTHNCFDYPKWVRARVERYARATCPSRRFNVCVERHLGERFFRR